MSKLYDFFARSARFFLVFGCFGAGLFTILYKVLFRISFLMLVGAAVCAVLALWGFCWLRPACRVRRILRRALLICVCLGLCVVTALELCIASGARGDPREETDWLIVLGCGLYGDQPTLALQSRLAVALRYLEAYPESRAVLSGSQGPHEDITEALAMARWLMDRGIAPGRLVLEQDAHNTIQNLGNSFACIPEGDTVTVVSNEFHLFRVQKISAWYGRPVRTLPAPTPTVRLNKVNSWLREAASLVLMAIKLR